MYNQLNKLIRQPLKVISSYRY